jgi:hypothetical protein
MIRLRKLLGLDGDLSRIQDNVDQSFQDLQSSLLPLSGVVLIGQSIGTSATTLTHGLGRPYQGFIIARLSANAVIWEPGAANTNPSTTIVLQASSACTANVWVY